jgi:hypothetical protein
MRRAEAFFHVEITLPKARFLAGWGQRGSLILLPPCPRIHRSSAPVLPPVPPLHSKILFIIDNLNETELCPRMPPLPQCPFRPVIPSRPGGRPF